MFSNESPFSFMSNQAKNNNFQFKNNLSNRLTESNNEFFSIEDKNYQSKTKQRFAFYNNGTPSQIKECLDYFLNEPNANINFIYCAGNNFPFNFKKNEKENENEKKSKNSSINKSIDSHLNNSRNKNDEFNENENDKDSSCPPPPSKKSVNSCFSASTFNSSINSVNSNSNNNNNNNCFEGKLELKIDLLGKDLGYLNLNERKIVQNKEKSPNNPVLNGRISELQIDY